MLASFQLSGMIPYERVRLNNLHIKGPISSAILRKSLLGMLSGPHALFGSKLRSTSAIASGVNWMLDRQLVLALAEAVKLVGGSRSGGEKTEWKKRLKTFAFSTLSFMNSRPSLRKVGFWFIFVDVFINNQKRFGFSNSERLSLVTWAFFSFEIICLVWCLSCRYFSTSMDAFVFSAFFLCLFFFFMSVRSSVSTGDRTRFALCSWECAH